MQETETAPPEGKTGEHEFSRWRYAVTVKRKGSIPPVSPSSSVIVGWTFGAKTAFSRETAV
jgi:hypothetical protein